MISDGSEWTNVCFNNSCWLKEKQDDSQTTSNLLTLESGNNNRDFRTICKSIIVEQ